MPFPLPRALLMAGLILSAAPLLAAPAPQAALRDLAPSGRLKVAINLGNAVLAQQDKASGELKGVSVTLARALGERLGVPVDLIPFRSAGETFDALTRGEWSVGFMAIDPMRAEKIEFSKPYVVIEGSYLIRRDAPFRDVEDLDRPGVRIAVARGSAYDLFLSRTLKHAQLVRTVTSPEAIDLFGKDHLDAAAGVRQALEPSAKGGLVVMKGRFMRIEQAVAVPVGHPAGAAYVQTFIQDMMASGAVRAGLAANGQDANLAVGPAPSKEQ